MNYKTIRFALLCLGFSCPFAVHAGALLMDARMDYVTYAADNEVGKPGYEAFQVSRLKIDYQGALGDVNAFRARIDLLQNSAAATTRDRTSKYVDFAYLTHKFSDSFNFSMGKIITGMGGTEGSNNPGDVYQRSTAGNESAAIYWPVGAQAELKYEENKLRLNIANNTEDIYDDNTKKNLSQTATLIGATYTGSFVDGMVLPNVSYHQEKLTSTTNVTKKNSYLAAGARLKFWKMEFEADYLDDVFDRDPQATSDVLRTTSAVALIRYFIADIGSFHVKYEDTTQKTATSATNDGSVHIAGWTGAFEYKPVSSENWRMHLAYTQKNTSPVVTPLQVESTIYAGMRILADFLK